jgi:hypothetical protein
MFDGLSLPGAPKHLATPAVNKSGDVRRVEKHGGSRPFYHLAQGTYFRHKPVAWQTVEAPEHDRTSSLKSASARNWAALADSSLVVRRCLSPSRASLGNSSQSLANSMRRAAERLPRDDPTVVGTRMRNLGAHHHPAWHDATKCAMFCLSGLKKALNFRGETASACPPDTYRLPHITGHSLGCIHAAGDALPRYRLWRVTELPPDRLTG